MRKYLNKYTMLSAGLVITFLIALAINNMPISPTKLINDLSKSNNITIENGTILVENDKFIDLLKISKSLAKKYDLNSIYINNDLVVFNDSSAKFYYVIDDNYICIRSSYLIKPSINDIKLTFGSKTLNYKLQLKYKSDFKSLDTEYWYQNPPDWVSLSKNGVLLKNSDNKVSSFGFRRRFENNVKLTASILPEKYPLNLALFLGEGVSAFVSINDDRTIQIIHAKNIGGKKLDLKKKQVYRMLKLNKPYSIAFEKQGNTYNLYITGEDKAPDKWSYVDTEPETNIKSDVRNIGLSVWRGGNGVLIKAITIESSEKL